MGNVVNNLAGAFNAAVYYFKSAVALLVSNPWLLGLSIFMLISAGKSFKLGSLVSAKG